MKNLYLLALCMVFCIKVIAQNNPTQSNAVAQYEKSLNEKEDFWSKLKRPFRSKEKTQTIRRTSDPVLVKNDPNRNVRRVPRSHYKTHDTIRVKPGRTEAELAEKTASKKSFGQKLNQLVNGKDYVAPKKYNQIKRNIPQEDDFMAMGKVKKAERENSKKVNKEEAVKVVAKTPEEKQQQKQIARQNAKYYASLNKKSTRKDEVKSPTEKVEAESPVIEPEVIDNTIRNEIKPLSLTRTASGNASYFVTAVAGAKFFVLTNLAAKGSLIKVVNPQNGRYLLAEVMDQLPAADSKRGLLLKLSDNARMPLGQNNNSFSVKVNY